MIKKGLLALLFVGATFIGCQENSTEIPNEQQVTVDMTDFYLFTDDAQDLSKTAQKGKDKNCYSMEVLNRQLNEIPGLYKKMYDVEHATRKFLAGKGKPTNGGGGSGGGGGTTDVDVAPINDGLGIVNIPVYVHVVYSNSNQNISNAQVTSQINVLNEDFRKTNNDLNLPSGTTFANDATDAEIEFTLANTFRYANARTSWGTRNEVKAAYPPVTPSTHLNIWVAEIGGGILGYAQFPGGASATDGVVISPQYFGTTGFVAAPFDKGRTATHEVGHYLNLRHIWGDGRCRQDDFVADTPSSDGPNYGCPSYPTVNCKTPDMTMNYMDYTNDACMYMFTDGQRNRMRAILVAGGARASLAGN
ncbi:zinc metalloprotease [uncultured Polaribacter sp.]|uniref:zinc metalloprotease n=1 Tax=uncultured Polaribacter sp. TaxID=174711 RepID=UPI0026250DAA|nr:zinc metalloprotease [uncultured Polaribacter sp.]